MGKLFVIEGLDGSGKATQAELLAHALAEMGKQVRKISFPNYESNSSALVKMYLNGDFGTDPADVNAYAASSFFAVDRYAGFKADWGAFYRDGGILIADRYTTSNGVHQCCKLPPEQWEEYISWLFDFEYRLLGIPAPDAVVYLKLDVEESQKLMTHRYHGDEQRKDIHETSLDYQRRAQSAANWCADHLGWHTVRCLRNGALRGKEDIGAEVLAYVREVLHS
ncbi:MAG: deoxynucleoside kinase [Clostridia bacterium]|nr:deoxynucleoside kinase [Clostridia bacterium]